MLQSLACIHLHVVFSTKNREPWLAPDFVSRLYEYMGGTLRGNKCALLNAGGMPDHVHLLISMSRELSVADVVRIVKSNSSRWIHDTFPDLSTFAWQAGYGAFSVSYSQIEKVQRYIRRQAIHHKRRSFQDEFRIMLQKHKLEWDERYVWD